MLGKQEDKMAEGDRRGPETWDFVQAARGDLLKNVIKTKQVTGED